MWYNRKEKKGVITMQKKHQQACFATFVLTVLLTLWRVLIAPQPSKYSGAYGALLIATAIAVVAILVWCGLKREELREVQGSSAMATTLASLFVGRHSLSPTSRSIFERAVIDSESFK